jgi:hypothetical protein
MVIKPGGIFTGAIKEPRVGVSTVTSAYQKLSKNILV